MFETSPKWIPQKDSAHGGPADPEAITGQSDLVKTANFIPMTKARCRVNSISDKGIVNVSYDTN